MAEYKSSLTHEQRQNRFNRIIIDYNQCDNICSKEMFIKEDNEGENNMVTTCQPASTPPKPLPPHNTTINESFDLGLFSYCQLCNKNHFKFTLKKFDNQCVCKECCKKYDIDTIDRLETVRNIRNEIVKNMINSGGLHND